MHPNHAVCHLQKSNLLLCIWLENPCISIVFKGSRDKYCWVKAILWVNIRKYNFKGASCDGLFLYGMSWQQPGQITFEGNYTLSSLLILSWWSNSKWILSNIWNTVGFINDIYSSNKQSQIDINCVQVNGQSLLWSNSRTLFKYLYFYSYFC